MKNKQITASYIWIFIFSLSFGVFMYFKYQKPRMIEPEVLQVAPPVPILSKPSLSQVSGDGTHLLAIKQMGELAEIIVNGEMILTQRVDPDKVLSIPFNAWSPDNRYFFVKQRVGDVDEYLVMTSTGKAFASGESYLFIRDLYLQAYPENEIVTVSGWAAPTLIVLNARSKSEESISFWFDVQTKKFIRLSTNFY